MRTHLGPRIRLPICYVLCAVIIALTGEAIRWAHQRHLKASGKTDIAAPSQVMGQVTPHTAIATNSAAPVSTNPKPLNGETPAPAPQGGDEETARPGVQSSQPQPPKAQTPTEPHVDRTGIQSKKPVIPNSESVRAIQQSSIIPNSPVPAAPTTIPQQQVIDPAVQLLERAVEAVRSCHSFQTSSMKRMMEAQARIQQHNSRPGVTEESKSRFAQWEMGINIQEDMQLYSQVYKQEFMEVRRLLVLKGMDEQEPGINYENPGNMGGVTGICFDLTHLTEAYINRQYAEEKINREDAQRYLGLLRPTLPDVNH